MKKTYEAEKHYAPAYKSRHYHDLVDFLREKDSEMNAEIRTLNKYADMLSGAEDCVARIEEQRDEVRAMLKACEAAIIVCTPAVGVFAKHHRNYLTGAEVNTINKAESLYNAYYDI